MAHLLGAEALHVEFPTKVVFDSVTLGVGEGDRIGIVGRNGDGKSTLLKLLAGTMSPDSGRVARVNGLRVGVLDQQDSLVGEQTIGQAVVGDMPEHEWAGNPRTRDVIAGLLSDLSWDAVIGSLSGGQRRRVQLAQLLIGDWDLICADEPTNHLDVEGVAWLAQHLAQQYSTSSNAIVAITHDRWFLDAIATMTWEVVDGQVNSFEGGYAAYVLAKAERSRIAAVTAERRDNLLRKELAWLRRGAPARTSKPKFRIDAANALIADEPPPRDDVELSRFATSRLGKDVIDLHDASVVVGGRTLLDRVTWHLAPGERIGIVGVNGAGKSTLLRVLSGEVPLTSGTRKEGVTVQVAFLSQEVRELEEWKDRRVIEAVESVRSVIRLGRREISDSQLAQRLGFTGPRQQTRVGDLSGGERRRLQLTRLLMSEPNVLMLDEPTNDLDIETLTSLEDVLDGWAGTLLVVSHDRYLLERVCDRQVALLGDGKVRELPGGVEQYLELRATTPDARHVARAAAASAAASAAAAAADAQAPSATTPAAATRTVTAAEEREARKTMNRVDRSLSKLADREAKVHAAMAEAAADHAKVLDLNRDLRAIIDEREALELEWLEAAEIVG